MPRLLASSLRSGFNALPWYFCLLLATTATAANDCTRLQQVEIEPSETFSPRAGRALISPFIGRCIDAGLMREMLSAISNDLIERGYITSRPYLLEQDVSDGNIEVKILDGRIEKIIDSTSGVSTRRIDSAFLFNRDILNLRDLESALEVIERLPSVQAGFEIGPGSSHGSSIVAVRVEESNPLRLELGASAQTDLDDRLGLYLAIDNPAGINDQLGFRVNNGEILETYQSNQSEEISYSFVLGSYVVGLRRVDIEFEQRVQGNNDSFLSEGETTIETLRVDKTFARSQSGRWGFALTLELNDSKNFFEDEIVDVSSYRTSQLRLELNHAWLQSWGNLSSYGIYHQGLDSFGARDDDYFRSEGVDGGGARLQFEKITLGGDLNYFLPRPDWRLNLNFHLQYSDDLLFENDRLNLGSEYTVRGYSSALSGSNAWYLRSGLVRQLRVSAAPLAGADYIKSIALSFGIDYGDVKCETDNPDSCGEIYSAALGILVWDDNFSGRLSWGHPLKKIDDDVGDEDIYLLDLRWML